MNVNLAYYSFADNKFYEPLDVLNADITIFKAVSSACSNEYEIYESGIYLCATSKLKMPKQGWKIHISASYDNAIHILNIVAKELVPQKCSFKVIKSLDLYLLTSQKPFSRIQFGKFITVYPESNSRFIALLEILNKKLSNFEGPEILTDRQYKQCKVLHYRYGGFEPIEKVTPYGQTLYLIQNGFGALTEDVRSPYYSLPIGIEEIILNEPILEIPRLFREYSVEKAIRFTNSGGVYEAKQKSTQRRVIIKEARPFTQMTKASVNSIKLRKKEAEILQNCKNSSFFPELIDSFDDSGHYFIVEEYIEGETLFHYVLHNNPFLKMKGSEPARRYIKTIVTFVADLFSAIVYLSSKGYEMHDLTPDNVMITDGGQIKIVDMEGCLRTGESEAFIGKNSFVMNGDRRFAALKELGLLLLSCIVTGKDALLALNRDAIYQQLEHIDHLYSLCDEIKELILELTFARESSFIAVRRIIDNLQRKPLEKLVTRLNGEFQPNTHDDIARVLSGIIGTHGKTKKSTFPITPLFGNSMNYACGEAGIANGLVQLGHMDFNKNFTETCSFFSTSIPVGLYTGWGGCIWSLAESGNCFLGEELYQKHCRTSIKLNEHSFFAGRAGLLILAIRMFDATQNTCYYDDARMIADSIMQEYDYMNNQHIGLMRGNAGVALSMLAAYCLFYDSKYIEYGKTLLDRDLEFSFTDEEKIGFPAKKGSNTVLPYFMEGTCGVLSVLLRYMPYFNGYSTIAQKLAQGLHFGFSVSASLFDGMAGIGNTLIDCFHSFGKQQYFDWALEAAHFCWAHRIPYDNETIVFPDSYCQRISSDYGYGSMGILLFLNRIRTREIINFAIPLDDFIRGRLEKAALKNKFNES